MRNGDGMTRKKAREGNNELIFASLTPIILVFLFPTILLPLFQSIRKIHQETRLLGRFDEAMFQQFLRGRSSERISL